MKDPVALKAGHGVRATIGTPGPSAEDAVTSRSGLLHRFIAAMAVALLASMPGPEPARAQSPTGPAAPPAPARTD